MKSSTPGDGVVAAESCEEESCGGGSVEEKAAGANTKEGAYAEGRHDCQLGHRLEAQSRVKAEMNISSALEHIPSKLADIIGNLDIERLLFIVKQSQGWCGHIFSRSQ